MNFGVLVEAGYDAALRGGAAGTVQLMSPPTGASTAVGAVVERAIATQDGLVRAARFAAAQAGVSFDAALQTARTRQADAPGVAVAVESLADSSAGNPSGFTIGAQSQVLLFMFLTSLTGATELIVTRQLGISRRMFSTPTSMAAIILGEGAGRLALALFQGAFIVLASALLFNVDWADPAATTAIVVVFAFVSAGAALLIGTLVRNGSQAGAIAPAIGLTVALLGGTMVPPEVFPETMRTLGHLTPHAWAMDAFRGLAFRGEGRRRDPPGADDARSLRSRLRRPGGLELPATARVGFDLTGRFRTSSSRRRAWRLAPYVPRRVPSPAPYQQFGRIGPPGSGLGQWARARRARSVGA